MFTLKEKVLAVLLVLGIVAGVVGFRSWLAEHEARLQAEAKAKVDEAAVQSNQQQISAIQKQMADRDAAYQEQLKTLDAKFASATSPQAIAQLASQLMGLKEPIQIIQPAPTAADPHPAPQAVVPQIDFPQAKTYVQDCESCKLERTKLQQDAADRAKQAVDAQKIIDAQKQEIATWKTVAKGGTWWQRTVRAAKWVGLGAAVGAAAVCGSGHCK